MSQKVNGGGRERVLQVANVHFKIWMFRAKISLFFLPKIALVPAKNGQMRGNRWCSTYAARLPSAKGPSTAL